MRLMEDSLRIASDKTLTRASPEQPRFPLQPQLYWPHPLTSPSTIQNTAIMAAEQRKLLGMFRCSFFSLTSFVPLYCNERIPLPLVLRTQLILLRTTHGRRLLLACRPTKYNRPQNLPLIPRRDLSSRSFHQHQAGSRSLS